MNGAASWALMVVTVGISAMSVVLGRRPASDEPQIHDRELDVILGVPTVAVAVWLALGWPAGPVAPPPGATLSRLVIVAVALVTGVCLLVLGTRLTNRMRWALLAPLCTLPALALSSPAGTASTCALLAASVLAIARGHRRHRRRVSGTDSAVGWPPSVPLIPATVPHTERETWLEQSVWALRRAAPDLSAHRVLHPTQRVVLLGALALFTMALLVAPEVSLRVVVAATTLLYVSAGLYRVVLVQRGLRSSGLVTVGDADARAVRDDQLPAYTVLVPAYREPATTITQLVEAMGALDYPADKLDVRLLVEEDDDETIVAAAATTPGTVVQIVTVPRAEPRTKPKACNYGLQSARGELVTIYDAEDRPEPLQLRRAAIALDRLGPHCACVQARLGFFNSRTNLITRLFTIDYAQWFGLLLPGLVSVGAPIPLGGTSNHFRTDLLRSVGAWDPYNVTEDADLGIRLARLGYDVAVLDSETAEEANTDFVNWVKQRSRWYKGYLQTWLVHMRRPLVLTRELGWRGTLGLNLFVLGTPLTALLNLVFWALTAVWLIQQPAWLQGLFPPAVFYVALVSLVVGNAAFLYLGVLTVAVARRPDLLLSALAAPIYWLMMSLAATKAVYQLVFSPSYWEKTAHGLSG